MSEFSAVSHFFKKHPFPKHLLLSVVIWLCLIAVSALINNQITLTYGRESSFGFHFTYLIPWYLPHIILSIFVVYAVPWLHSRNYSLRRLIFQHTSMFVVYNTITTISGAFLVFVITGKLAEKEQFWEGMQVMLVINRWQYEILIYVAVVLIGFLVSYVQQIRMRDVQNAELKAQLYKVELDALRAQLNPHFLFNALNTISGLTRVGDASKATKALSELSFMLRSVLETPNKQVTLLRDELEFVQKYLHFQDLRFGERIKYKVDVSPQCPNITLPFLLVHTLVENAVKHGSNMDEEQNEISLKASLNKDKVCIILTNTASEAYQDSGFGIGVINCEKRLRHIYGDDFLLNAYQQNNLYVTELQLPLGQLDA